MELVYLAGDKVLTYVSVGDFVAVFNLVFDKDWAALAGEEFVRLSVRICDDNVGVGWEAGGSGG